MASLATIQRAVDREAKKIGVTETLRAQFAGPSTCKLSRAYYAHAHNNKRGNQYGLICFQRGLEHWLDTVKHEVAHFVPGGRHDGIGFLRARAAQGSQSAKAQLRSRGKLRCSKHVWVARQRLDIVEDATAKGLWIMSLHAATCQRCGKQIGD